MNRDKITLGAKLTFRHFTAWLDDYTDYDCVVVGFASNGAPIVEVPDGNSIKVFLVENLEDLSPRTIDTIWWGRLWIDSDYEPHFCGYFRSEEELSQQELPPGGTWFRQPQSLLVKVPVDE